MAAAGRLRAVLGIFTLLFFPEEDQGLDRECNLGKSNNPLTYSHPRFLSSHVGSVSRLLGIGRVDQTERRASWEGEQTHGTRKLSGPNNLSRPLWIHPIRT